MNKTQQMKAAIARGKEQAAKATPELAAAMNAATPEEIKELVKPAKKHWGDQRLPMEKAGDDKRLPNGSRFETEWDGETRRWTGYLLVKIGSNPTRAQAFKDESSAVMKLLKKLDAQYRAWLAAKNTGKAVVTRNLNVIFKTLPRPT